MMQYSQLLFVYGTLQKGFDNPFARMVTKQGRLLGRASMQGLLYDVGTYPCAVCTGHTSTVWGELYHFDNPDTILHALDEYEGDEYERQLINVHIDGDTCTAWAYLYTADTSLLKPIAPGDYRRHIHPDICIVQKKTDNKLN